MLLTPLPDFSTPPFVRQSFASDRSKELGAALHQVRQSLASNAEAVGGQAGQIQEGTKAAAGALKVRDEKGLV
jgi:hypothetical protein